MKRTIGMVAGLSVMALLCQGCVLAVAGIIADHEMTNSGYNGYVKDVRKDNTERQEHGLQPNPIMSRKDWKKGLAQPVTGLTTNAPVAASQK